MGPSKSKSFSDMLKKEDHKSLLCKRIKLYTKIEKNISKSNVTKCTIVCKGANNPVKMKNIT